MRLGRGSPDDSVYQRTILKESALVRYYPLDEGYGAAIDRVGAVNGTVSGAKQGVPDVILGGQAYLFDGVDDNVTTSDDFTVSFPTAFTVEALILTTSSANQRIAGKLKNTAPLAGWQFDLISGKLYFERDGSGGFSDYNGVATVRLGRWNHAAFSYDGSATNTGRLYLNAVEDMNRTESRAIASTTNAFRIGYSSENDLPFKGLIRHVALYNAALSPQTLKNHVRAAFG